MLSKADTEAVRRQNRRIAIEHIRRWRTSTRKRLSEETGLSISGASAIAGDLVREGLLAETLMATAGPRRGRPEIGLAIAGAAARIATVRIAVGEVSVAIVDYAGVVLAGECAQAALMSISGDALVGLVEAMVGRALAAAGPGGPLRFVVVAVQGVTDAQSRRLLWSPIVGSRDVDLGGPLRELLGAPVIVTNDCSLMPERFRWSADGQMRDFATLFIGFGVGMGLCLSGATFKGAHTSAAEFGHMNHIPGGDVCRCGNRGCIEAYAGDYAILRAARGDSGGSLSRRVSDAEMKGIADSARSGDRRAIAAFERAGEALGYGLGRLFTLIDPLPIVFTGSGALAMDLLEPSIRRSIAACAIAGVDADIRFDVHPDVDTIVLEASIAHALAAVDDIHATPGYEPVSAKRLARVDAP